MARYSEAHKVETRARIVETAGRRFKCDGIDGSGVAVLMKDAGLTNGAFYAHFPSKDALVAEVVAAELATQLAAYDELPPGRAGVEQIVRRYLSVEHRDAVAAGCPSAALLDEIARSDEPVRAAYDAGVAEVVEAMARRLEGTSRLEGDSLRTQVLSAYALMIGTLQVARSLVDDACSRAVLERGVDNVLALLA